MDRLAGLVLSDIMIGSAYERMGSGLPVWLAPSADLTVHLFEEAQSPWLLARNRARRADQGYLSVELELSEECCVVITNHGQRIDLQ